MDRNSIVSKGLHPLKEMAFKNLKFKITNLQFTMAFSQPNPAKEWAAFSFTLPDNESEGIIQISVIEGKLVESLPISGKQGQIIWDTRIIKPGAYFYTLNVSGFNRTGKMIISK
jgi:hypothetical protein